MASIRQVEFRGSALHDLRAFPQAVKREAGFQLDQIQRGREPGDWRPMKTIGQGVNEIRLKDMNGIFRIIYLAKFADVVYVLHCFQKKTERTSRSDLELARNRYVDLLHERGKV